MAHSISFIGSFRKKKHYAIVKKGVFLFKDKGIQVNSPRGAAVCGKIDQFVIFTSDEQGMTPEEIQMITLDKILKSDVVFVCNLDGYVGKTTCYEIGFCFSRNIPLYFLSKPVDLPIPVPQDHIVSLEKMLNIALQNQEEPILDYDFGILAKNAMNSIMHKNVNITENESKRIVICGSMQFYTEMRECQNRLIKKGIDAIVPKDEDNIPENISEEEFRQFKKRVSSAYLKKIRMKETGAVLVFNAPKRGIENYIGANTFVELAMAFSWNRKIYLLHDYYEPYLDELKAWDVVCLHGNLINLINEWKQLYDSHQEEHVYTQLSLMDLGMGE